MFSEDTMQLWEFLSYLVTVLGLPMAAFLVWREMRAERINEAKEIEQREDEIYIELSQQYSAFLQAALTYPQLNLFDENAAPLSDPVMIQQRRIYYEMLIALFERAYILLYEEGATALAARRWQSWSDYIDDWLKRPDFRAYALDNLEGEDPDFAAFLQRKAAADAGVSPRSTSA